MLVAIFESACDPSLSPTRGPIELSGVPLSVLPCEACTESIPSDPLPEFTGECRLEAPDACDAPV